MQLLKYLAIPPVIGSPFGTIWRMLICGMGLHKPSSSVSIEVPNPAEFDQLLGKLCSSLRCTILVFVPESIDAYPDAKVVLVERDIEAWYGL